MNSGPHELEKFYSIDTVECFQFIDLDNYTPENKQKRTKFMNNLKLNAPVMLTCNSWSLFGK